MQINTFRIGDHVMVTAKDDFYAHIDGWRGRIGGFNIGMAEVDVHDEGINKVFLVPFDELVLIPKASV